MVQIFYQREHGSFTQEQIERAITHLEWKYRITKCPDIKGAYAEDGTKYLESAHLNTVFFWNDRKIIVIETPSNKRVIRGSKEQGILEDLAKILNPDIITDFARNRFKNVEELVQN